MQDIYLLYIPTILHTAVVIHSLHDGGPWLGFEPEWPNPQMSDLSHPNLKMLLNAFQELLKT